MQARRHERRLPSGSSRASVPAVERELHGTTHADLCEERPVVVESEEVDPGGEVGVRR